MRLSMLDPEPTELNAPFWQGIAEGQLQLPRCSVCRTFQWYPDTTGPDCPGGEYEWVPSSGVGIVHTMTRVHRAFLPGAGDGVPYLIGLIDLDDAPGVRLVAQLVDEAGVGIGDRVRATFVGAEDGRRLRFARELLDESPRGR